MKRLSVLLCCLLCCLAGASSKNVADITKRISAYKYGSSFGDGTPSSPTIRILDSSDNEISTNSDIAIGVMAIESEKLAFSWVFSGNSATPVTLSFSFSPLQKVDYSEFESIPYTIRIAHERTRVANSILPASGITHSLNGVTYNFAYTEGMNGPTINPAQQTFAQKAEGSQSLTVQYHIGCTITPAYSGSLSVIDQWSRYGNAYITLNITDTMTFTPGLYRINVTVSCTTT